MKNKFFIFVVILISFILVTNLISAFQGSSSSYTSENKLDSFAESDANSTSFSSRLIGGIKKVGKYVSDAFSGRFGILDLELAINITSHLNNENIPRGGDDIANEDDKGFISNLVNFTAQVFENGSTSSGFKGATCYFYDNNNLFGSSSTNNSGHCTMNLTKSSLTPSFRNMTVNYSITSSDSKVLNEYTINYSLVVYFTNLSQINRTSLNKYYSSDLAILEINITKTNSTGVFNYDPANISANATDSALNIYPGGELYYPGNVSRLSQGRYRANVSLDYSFADEIRWDVILSDNNFADLISISIHADVAVCATDFGAWGSWTTCSSGVQTRSRTDSTSCTEVQTQSCTTGGGGGGDDGGGGGEVCVPLWGAWSGWSDCIQGEERRTRGDGCGNTETEIRPCGCMPNWACGSGWNECSYYSGGISGGITQTSFENGIENRIKTFDNQFNNPVLTLPFLGKTFGKTIQSLAITGEITKDIPITGTENFNFGVPKIENCGNGILDEGEECDGTNLNDKTCISQGFDSGALGCTSECKFDTSSCQTEEPPPTDGGDGDVGDRIPDLSPPAGLPPGYYQMCVWGDLNECGTNEGKPDDIRECIPGLEAIFLPENKFLIVANGTEIEFSGDISSAPSDQIIIRWKLDSEVVGIDSGLGSLFSTFKKVFTLDSEVKAEANIGPNSQTETWKIIINPDAKPDCEEEWYCEWTPCDESFTKQPFNCQDVNQCGTNINFPIPMPCDCISEYECEEWSECQVDYNIENILFGNVSLNGIQQHTCNQITSCEEEDEVIVEEENCNLRSDIIAKAVEWCYEDYIEIYDAKTNELVSRFKKRNIDGIARVDIGFIATKFEGFCDYCFDNIKNFDEEGVDCGGVNCPGCVDIGDYFDYVFFVKINLWILLILLILYFVYDNRDEMFKIKSIMRRGLLLKTREVKGFDLRKKLSGLTMPRFRGFRERAKERRLRIIGPIAKPRRRFLPIIIDLHIRIGRAIRRAGERRKIARERRGIIRAERREKRKQRKLIKKIAKREFKKIKKHIKKKQVSRQEIADLRRQLNEWKRQGIYDPTRLEKKLDKLEKKNPLR